MNLIRRFLFAWGFNLLALFAAAELVDGVTYGDDFGTLVLAALAFAFVNMLLKPVVKFLSLPIILITLGVALFFINMLMLYMTDWIVGGFEIDSFGAAVWATIVVWGVNWVLHIVFDVDDRNRRRKARTT